MKNLKVKGGTWEIIFRYCSQDGKPTELNGIRGLTGAKSEQKIKDLLIAQLHDLQNALTEETVQHDALFLDAMKTWLDEIMVNQVRYNTLIQYRRAFEYNIESYIPFQDLKLSDLTPRLLQEFYNEKVKAGLSANTIHKLHANIHKFLNYAVSLDMLPLNPADRVVLPKKERADVGKAYTVQQLQDLVSLFHGDILELIVYLEVMYGLRRSEVCGLRWEAVDFENRCISIHHTAVVINGEVIRSNRTKSRSSRRILPMNEQVYEKLQAVQKAQGKLAQELGKLWPASGYVCVRQDGQPIDPTFVSHHFARVLKKSNLPYIRFHDIRHSVASLLHSRNFDLKDIQEWMGHSDISTTGNIYSHLEQERMRGMAEAIESALDAK